MAFSGEEQEEEEEEFLVVAMEIDNHEIGIYTNTIITFHDKGVRSHAWGDQIGFAVWEDH